MTERRLRAKPWVVKLGGSLAGAPSLRGWLAAIGNGGGRVVVVPGGGPYADAVRAAQPRCGFDDATAHRMAILAMEQYAQMLAGLSAQLTPVATRSAIARTLWGGGVPVWLPARMLLGRSDVAQSWDVTSDSLAAWLASALDAERLVLVKSVAVAAQCAASDLASAGVVDRAFPEYVERCRAECRIVAAADDDAFARMLRGGAPAGTRVARRGMSSTTRVLSGSMDRDRG